MEKPLDFRFLVLSFVVFLASCGNDHVTDWLEQERELKKYGERFLGQNELLDAATSGKGRYSFLTKDRKIIKLDRGTVLVDGGVSSEAYIVANFNVDMSRLGYWARALETLNAHVISKHELNCACVHIGVGEDAPFSGNDSAAGWFYIPGNDIDSERAKNYALSEKVVMDTGWYWGIHNRP